MRKIYDNFGNLPTNARESSLGPRNDVELNNLWFCVTTAQGGNNPLSLTFIEEKKNRSGSWNPATTKMEFYVTVILDLLLKRNQRIYRHFCHSTKITSFIGTLKNF